MHAILATGLFSIWLIRIIYLFSWRWIKKILLMETPMDLLSSIKTDRET